MNAIEKAKEIGTYQLADRSKQYTKVTNGELLHSLNEAWTKIRTCEAENRRKDEAITELKLDRRSLKMWLRLIVLVVSVEGALIAWLATSLLDCIRAAR